MNCSYSWHFKNTHCCQNKQHFLTFSHAQYMRKYCDSGKIWSWDFDRFTHFEATHIWKSSFSNVTIYQYVHMYVWMYTLLRHEQLDKFCIYIIFCIYKFIHHRSENSSSKKHRTAILLKTALTILIKFLYFLQSISLNKNA